MGKVKSYFQQQEEIKLILEEVDAREALDILFKWSTQEGKLDIMTARALRKVIGRSLDKKNK